MIVSKKVLSEKLFEMIDSFRKEYNSINDQVYRELEEKIEIMLDQLEISMEKDIIEKVQPQIIELTRKVVSELITL